MPRASCLTAPLALLLAAPAVAQLPPGYFAVGTGQVLAPNNNAWTGPTGINVGHPRNPGSMTPITGLPASLLNPAPDTTSWWGVGAMALHEPSGDLLVGDIAWRTTPGPISLFRIAIDTPTLTVTNVTTFALGSGAQGDVNQIAWLDADRVVVAGTGVSGPVGTGPTYLAEVDLTTGAITPWPVSALFTQPFSGQAICIDRDAGLAYVGGTTPGTASSIYRVPLANPSTRTFVASVPVFLDNLQFDPDLGRILAGGRSNSASNGAIFRIDPSVSPATVTTLLPDWQNAPAIALEQATGDLIFGGVQRPGTTIHGIWHFDPSVPPTFLSNTTGQPPITPARPMGVVVAPDPDYYGSATATDPTAPLLPWRRWRLPGGLPLLGNGNFALELDVPVGATLMSAFALASFGRATPGVPTLPGTTLGLHIDLGQSLGGVAMGASPTLLLPIPNNANLLDLAIDFQALTLSGYPGGVAFGASDGAEVTVL